MLCFMIYISSSLYLCITVKNLITPCFQTDWSILGPVLLSPSFAHLGLLYMVLFSCLDPWSSMDWLKKTRLLQQTSLLSQNIHNWNIIIKFYIKWHVFICFVFINLILLSKSVLKGLNRLSKIPIIKTQ